MQEGAAAGRGGEEKEKEKEKEERLTHPASVLLSSSFFFSSSLPSPRFSGTECGDLTLSVRPRDKFNHGVPSAKSWLNRNANNRALGPLINGNQED